MIKKSNPYKNCKNLISNFFNSLKTNDSNTTQYFVRTFGLFSGVLSILLFIVCMMVLLQTDGLPIGYDHRYLILISGLILILSKNINHAKYIQLIIISIYIFVSIFFFPNSGYGIINLLIFTFLIMEYDILKIYPIEKSLIFSLIYISLVIVSFKRANRESIYVITNLLIAAASLTTFYIFLLKRVKRAKSYKLQLKELKYRLKEMTSFINPIDAGLTMAELDVLEALCIYRESNIMLSKRLGKSKSTIKVQLLSIFNKIGVDNRYELIDSCRYYFDPVTNREISQTT